MKKNYSRPTAEKLAFRYRDQIVAASGDTGGGSPSIGGFYGNSSWGGGCKVYLAEAINLSFCNSQ